MFQPADFLTIALLVALEALLSADNAMVLAVLVLGLPKPEQRKALRYGIVGAFAFRTAATLAAAYLIRLGWVKLAGAGYLIYLAYQHFFLSDPETRRTPPRAKPWLGLSPFWATVVKVEVKKPAGKWEKVSGQSYEKIQLDPDTGLPLGLGLDTIPSFTMLMQQNKDRMVFARMTGAPQS